MAVAAGGKALAAQRPRRRRHRPGRSSRPARCRRRSRTRPRRVAAPARHRRARRVRPQRRLRRLLLRAGRRRPTRSGPAPAAQRAGHRRGEAVRLDRLDRPLHRDHLRATAPAPRWSARSDGEPAGIGPVVWGSAGDKADADHRSRTRDPVPQQEGQTVFRWATTALAPVAPAGLRAGRRRRRPSSPRSCRTRPTCASSRRSPASSAAPARSSPRTSSTAGNTSAASIPLALSRHGRARRGASPGDAGAAVRLRRRPDLRRAGHPLP